MKLQIAAGIVAVSMVGGVGTGLIAHQMRSGDDPDPKAEPTATATKKTAPTPKPSGSAGSGTKTNGGTKKTVAPRLPIAPVSSLRIIPGAVGPVQVGMSKQAAYATGYFDADVKLPEVCDRVDDLMWKAGYREVLDILTNDDGSVYSIGVHKPGPRTRSGLGVGNTYDTVRGVIGEVAPVSAGYNQTGLFVSEGNAWIGFLFNSTPDAITGSEPVSFIEVTRGAKPDLIRDGC